MAAGRDAAREALDVRESEERLDEPAMIVGYGPVPAPFARSLLRRWLDPNAVAGGTAGTDARSGSETTDASDSSSGVASASPSAVAADVERDVERDVEGARVWLRRLYADPGTGVLTDVDTKRRLFTAAQRRHLVFRDQFCRTPWCGAPIRHADHVYPWSRGGPTSIDNAQGLCALCNLVKETQGWSSRVEAKAEANRASAPRGDRGDRGDSRAAGVVTITTPSGATYRSRPPRLTRPVPASLDPVAVGA